jgi:type I restriction-modification system DNA methylase subunit/predicted type IV restriction endonuclease
MQLQYMENKPENSHTPQAILDLVKRFSDNKESYKSPTFNEAQLRIDFLNPFFEALGWDMANKQGFAEAYKEVVHEDTVKVGAATKAPDYSFRIGGQRKFFVEAKKPFVNIKEDIDPAFQLRRYAWSAKLPLSILTDFEEFSVYDCRVKPVKTDKASVCRLLYIRYDEYEARWVEIAGKFSKDAINKGSFDKFAADSKRGRGTTEVDDAFLSEIEGWRDLLARNIAIRNEKLSNRELNFAVQRTIDRLIFLRICEDRAIEDYGRLLAHLNGENIYKRLCTLFHEADDKYNSGLFHFREEKRREETPDDITLKLDIDDKVLKEIIENLYYPDCPYEFSVLPADILGQVYEQFLGKVIRLTEGHQAKVEDKPEVKKAGGVFYTPTYIVDYIVKNTVGKLLNTGDDLTPGPSPTRRGGMTPKEAAKLRILDPACGSGSFLIGAYQYLLDWHRDWYCKNGEEKWQTGKNPTLYKARGGECRLTTPERKRILLNNIYGVDIDTQAVEVTKLSLLLKVLEGENDQSIAQQLKLFHQRALPDLGNNIKCGNSLIGADFFHNQGVQETLALYGSKDEEEEEEKFKINAFDWKEKIGFEEIMKSGGFDAVIGNPPYVRHEMLGQFKDYFQSHYKVYNSAADLYAYFIERGVNLLNETGLFSFIVANKWMRANYGEPLRKWMKTNTIHEIVDFGDLPVFKTVTTYPCILKISRQKASARIRVCKVADLDFTDLTEYVRKHSITLPQKTLQDSGWSLADDGTEKLLKKIRGKGTPLGQYVNGQIYRGVLTGLNEAFVIDEKTRRQLIKEDKKSKEVIKPFLMGRNVQRYFTPENGLYLILIPKGWTKLKLKDHSGDPWKCLKTNLPAIAGHLVPFEKEANKRFDQGDYWWELRACEYYDEFQKPKIIVPAITQTATYAFDDSGFFSNDKTSIIASDSFYLLGLLNSKTLDFVMHSISSTKQGGYFEYKPMYLSKIPIRSVDLSVPSEKKLHDNIIFLVSSLLSLHKKLETATGQLNIILQREIVGKDRRIDDLVYELYGLSAEEIKIVEGA